MYELIYTSAEKGLRAGSRGFCTVAITAGLTRSIITRLERLSSYEFLYELSSNSNLIYPINYMHTILSIDSRKINVISRVGFSGTDYSGRTNKIAHHIIVENSEQEIAGPLKLICLMEQKGIFYHQWDKVPKELPKKNLNELINMKDVSIASPMPEMWDKYSNSINAAISNLRKNQYIYIAYKPEIDILPLLISAFEGLRFDNWKYSFATYYTCSLKEFSHNIRGVIEGTTGYREMLLSPHSLWIDLVKNRIAPLNRNEWVPINTFRLGSDLGCSAEVSRIDSGDIYTPPMLEMDGGEECEVIVSDDKDRLEIGTDGLYKLEPVKGETAKQTLDILFWDTTNSNVRKHGYPRSSKLVKLLVVIVIVLLIVTAMLVYLLLRSKSSFSQPSYIASDTVPIPSKKDSVKKDSVNWPEKAKKAKDVMSDNLPARGKENPSGISNKLPYKGSDKKEKKISPSPERENKLSGNNMTTKIGPQNAKVSHKEKNPAGSEDSKQPNKSEFSGLDIEIEQADTILDEFQNNNLKMGPLKYWHDNTQLMKLNFDTQLSKIEVGIPPGLSGEKIDDSVVVIFQDGGRREGRGLSLFEEDDASSKYGVRIALERRDGSNKVLLKLTERRIRNRELLKYLPILIVGRDESGSLRKMYPVFLTSLKPSKRKLSFLKLRVSRKSKTLKSPPKDKKVTYYDIGVSKSGDISMGNLWWSKILRLEWRGVTPFSVSLEDSGGRRRKIFISFEYSQEVNDLSFLDELNLRIEMKEVIQIKDNLQSREPQGEDSQENVREKRYDDVVFPREMKIKVRYRRNKLILSLNNFNNIKQEIKRYVREIRNLENQPKLVKKRLDEINTVLDGLFRRMENWKLVITDIWGRDLAEVKLFEIEWK